MQNQLSSAPASAEGSWGWALALGIALAGLGLIAMTHSLSATVASMLVLGWLMIFGGGVHGVRLFTVFGGKHKFVEGLLAVVYILAGISILSEPLRSAVGLTLVMAIFFIASGIARIIGGFMLKSPARGWTILSGIVTLLLGLSVARQWPVSGFWVIGLFLGIDLLMGGCAVISFALAIRPRSHDRERSTLLGRDTVTV